MNESQIKEKLRQTTLLRSGGLVIEELPICGHAARADFAVIDMSISGFEIKSERDTLRRLENQILHYDKVFEYSWLVVAAQHFQEAKQIVPWHWGLMTVPGKKDLGLEICREPTRNAEISSNAILEFLWTNELIEILVENNINGFGQSWGRQKLRCLIADELETIDVVEATLSRMAARRRWQVASQRASCGG